MKLPRILPLSREKGHALVLVIAFVSITLLMLGAALDWCMTNASLTDRNNQYFSTVAAAEAATEKVVGAMLTDYMWQGESLVYARLPIYRKAVPTTAENPQWAAYAFNDAQGKANHVYVQRLGMLTNAPLNSQYEGLYGLVSTYRIVSNARMVDSRHSIFGAVKQDIQLASLPLFQFAIFYAMDCEINPGPAMTINGRVHGNGPVYFQPQNTLTFQTHVTSAGKLVFGKSPLDPLVRNTNGSKVVFKGEKDANIATVTLPIGTTNTPEVLHGIIDLPPDTETPDSLMGAQRYYNKADLVIVVSNDNVSARSGAFNSFGTVLSWGDISSFVNTNVSFFNKRETRTVRATQIDVAAFKTWSENNTVLRPALGNRDVRILYVADMRTQDANTQSGVRLKGGQTLPSLGLTVATPNPLYVWGHFNAPAGSVGTTNTAGTKPASLVADAVTILSTGWSDGDSSLGLDKRTAASTTVNAALLAGIVPSNGANYSGGVENFPRLLEDWAGRTFTYNGSIVALYYSTIATAPWGGAEVYGAPTRNWSFDRNFLDPAKLPPGTPEARALIRGAWSLTRPGTVL